ncbi:hypothetical protein HDV06_000742 [Boothiomyces sp. JEL0866]|nr:hypothetical protein HDV06_000732 [Boothiomyces sp. JEL0866]KAJ3318249.1 hypothetical protein HDV06_000742 [Boothiomyces sp. JEL0866]
MYKGWEDKVIYFDQIDIIDSNNVILNYCAVFLFLMCVLSIYAAGFLQIYVMGLILQADSATRRFVLKHPWLVFSLGYLPGPVCVIAFFLEISYSNITKIYSVVGYQVVPNINTYTVKFIYGFGILITIYACSVSMKCYKALKENKEKMFAAAKKSNVPNFVVFQVLEIGYAMPIVGLSKGLELLMWYYPSPVNLYYGTIGMVILCITPFAGFFSNGAHKNIYPNVPFFSGTLEKAYENIIKKEMKQVAIKQVVVVEPKSANVKDDESLTKQCLDGSTICLLIGFAKTFLKSSFQLMQYSGVLQISVTVGLCLFSVICKTMAIGANWESKVIFYDYPNIQQSENVMLNYLASCLFSLCFSPIYTAGLLQVFAMGKVLETSDSSLRRFIVNNPIFVFGLGYLPGLIFTTAILIESHFTNIDPKFTVVGCYVIPNIDLYSFKLMYIVALLFTFIASGISRKCFGLLKINKEKMFAAAKKSNVPNYVIFQVLQAGYSLPVVGLLKGFEMLMWYFPSVLNIYYCTLGLIVFTITPLLGFISNGAHQNIYPNVPVFSSFLGKVYGNIIKKEVCLPKKTACDVLIADGTTLKVSDRITQPLP